MFRALTLCAAAALVAVAAPAAAQSLFDGTWKDDPTASKVESKPDQFEVKDGIYSSSSGLPPLTVKAGGGFHRMKNRPYWDEIAVLVVNSRTLR